MTGRDRSAWDREDRDKSVVDGEDIDLSGRKGQTCPSGEGGQRDLFGRKGQTCPSGREDREICLGGKDRDRPVRKARTETGLFGMWRTALSGTERRETGLSEGAVRCRAVEIDPFVTWQDEWQGMMTNCLRWLFPAICYWRNVLGFRVLEVRSQWPEVTRWGVKRDN